jgi:hypothetical protein
MAIAMAEKVGGYISGVSQGEEFLPTGRFGGENDFAGVGVFADVDLLGGEAKSSGQADGLAAAVFEEPRFCASTPPAEPFQRNSMNQALDKVYTMSHYSTNERSRAVDNQLLAGQS